MICPRCGSKKVAVKDSRKYKGEVLRKRVCLTCGKRIYTVEKIDDTGYAVMKLSEFYAREMKHEKPQCHTNGDADT